MHGGIREKTKNFNYMKNQGLFVRPVIGGTIVNDLLVGTKL